MDLPVKVMRLGLDGTDKPKTGRAYTLYDYAGDEDFSQEPGVVVYIETKKANYEVILTEKTLRDALEDIENNRTDEQRARTLRAKLGYCDPEDGCPVCGNED